jgi:hypothetical protein
MTQPDPSPVPPPGLSPDPPHDRAPDAPAVMTAFTTCVFDAAGAIESLRHASELDDPLLAVLAGARLRTALAALESAYERLDAASIDEARALTAHLTRRALDALATAPGEIQGLTAIQGFIERFR